jgi:hypothetical protein
MSAAIGRGARLSREALNAFLSTKSAPLFDGYRIYPENNDALNQILHDLGLDPAVRVRAVIPFGRCISEISYILVFWEWNFVLYAKEIEASLPGRGTPAGFEEAIQKIERDAPLGLWTVCLTDEWGMSNEALADSVRIDPSQRCDLWQDLECPNLAQPDRTALIAIEFLTVLAESLHLRI